MLPPHSLFLFLLSLPLVALATTRAVNDADPYLSYLPATAWTTFSSDASLSDTTGHATSQQGATVSFSFAGDQVTILGSSRGPYRVMVDDLTIYEYDDATEGVLFRVSGLGEETTHTIVLVSEGGAGALLMIDTIRISFENGTGLRPSLVDPGSATATIEDTPTSEATVSPTTTLGSIDNSALPTTLVTVEGASDLQTPTQTSRLGTASGTSLVDPSALSTVDVRSSRSLISSSSSSASSFTTILGPGDSATVSEGTPISPGAIAGAVIGSLLVLAILLLACCVVRRRRRNRENGYGDAEKGQGPLVGNGSLSAGSGAGALVGDGGIGGSPRNGEPMTWMTLARKASWKRKTDRLPETRRFYKVSQHAQTDDLPPPMPPPSLPLPPPPLPRSSSSVLNMAEAHPPRAFVPITRIPPLAPRPPSPPVEPPSSTLITRPTRTPSQPLRPLFVVPPRANSSLVSSRSDSKAHQRSESNETYSLTSQSGSSTSLLTPTTPSLDHPFATTSSSHAALASAYCRKSHEDLSNPRRYSSQDDYYAPSPVGRLVFPLEEIEERPAKRSERFKEPGEEDRPGFFQNFSSEDKKMPRYPQAGGDPRKRRGGMAEDRRGRDEVVGYQLGRAE